MIYIRSYRIANRNTFFFWSSSFAAASPHLLLFFFDLTFESSLMWFQLTPTASASWFLVQKRLEPYLARQHESTAWRGSALKRSTKQFVDVQYSVDWTGAEAPDLFPIRLKHYLLKFFNLFIIHKIFIILLNDWSVVTRTGVEKTAGAVRKRRLFYLWNAKKDAEKKRKKERKEFSHMSHLPVMETWAWLLFWLMLAKKLKFDELISHLTMSHLLANQTDSLSIIIFSLCQKRVKKKYMNAHNEFGLFVGC